MNPPLPGRWTRRIVIHPLMWFTGVWLLAVAIPVGLIILAVSSYLVPGRLRVLRLLGFAIVYLSLEVVGITLAALTWVLSGFGVALRRDWFVELHYRILAMLLRILYWFAARLFALTVDDEGPELPGDDGDPTTTEHPLLVLSRHAGPGDSFLLVHELLSWQGRRPRIVLKDTLQLDPVIDLYLNRLPMRFVDPTSGDQAETLAAISKLAATMRDRDALLIFPEGGNVTPMRRLRAIERLRRSGRDAAARRAEGIQHLLPPRPAGVASALAANPGLHVVVVAHTGLDRLNTPRDIWRELPVSKTLHLRWHVIPGSVVPVELEGLSDWLFTEWERMDRWVSEHQDPGSARGGIPDQP